ncbi:protein kinase [bacterium]|nr:protein kinase [bacterium]
MKIGSYEVLSRIGQGGAGVVHLALSPDGRQVAIKVLKRPDTSSGRVRFEREQRFTSSLGEQDGFVPLVDSGNAREGPYLVMPFLPGGTLRDRLRRGPLAVDEALAIGRALSRAIGRAHERGIVHRDLKPENVLFTGDGRPLVTDLGLAKHFQGSPESGTSILVSQAGEVLGTALYMSCEQLANAAAVGPEGDVFAVGAILYECLTGTPAFNGASLQDVVSRIESGKFTPLARARPEMPAWLASAVERALARDCSGRFEDGRALALALEGGPEPPPRRRRLALVASVAVALGLGAGAVVAWLVAPRHEAASETGNAPPTPTAALSGNAAPPRPVSPPPVSPVSHPPVSPPPKPAPPPLPPVEPTAATPSEADVVGSPLACRGFLWGRKTRLAGVLGGYAGKHAGLVYRVAFSPDGKLGVSASKDGTIRAWELPSGNEVLALLGHTGVVNDLSVAPDGKLLLSASEDGTLRLWSLETGKAISTLTGHDGPVYTCAVSTDGKRAVSGGRDGTLRVWDLESGKALSAIRGHEGPVVIVASSQGGTRTLSGGVDNTARLWDVGTGVELKKLLGHQAKVQGLAFLPDGWRAITASADGTIRLWSLLTGEALRTIRAHKSVQGVAVSREGKRLLSGGDDGTIKLWDIETGELLRTCDETYPVTAVDLSSDGKLALTGSAAGGVRLWDLATGKPAFEPSGHTGPVSALAWSPDGKRALSSGTDLTVRVWDVARAKETGALAARTRVGGVSLAWSPNGHRALQGCEDGTIVFWEMPNGKELSRNPVGKAPVTAVAFSKEGNEIAAAGGDGAIAAWALDTGSNILRVNEGKKQRVWSLAFSADGKRLLGAGLEGKIHCVELATRSEVPVAIPAAPGPAKLSGDGKYALVPCVDERYRLFDVETSKEIVALSGKTRLGSLSFSKERERAVASDTGRVSVWGLASGEMIDQLDLAPDAPGPVALSPDGRSFLVGTLRGAILRFAFVEPGENR